MAPFNHTVSNHLLEGILTCIHREHEDFCWSNSDQLAFMVAARTSSSPFALSTRGIAFSRALCTWNGTKWPAKLTPIMVPGLIVKDSMGLEHLPIDYISTTPMNSDVCKYASPIQTHQQFQRKGFVRPRNHVSGVLTGSPPNLHNHSQLGTQLHGTAGPDPELPDDMMT